MRIKNYHIFSYEKRIKPSTLSLLGDIIASLIFIIILFQKAAERVEEMVTEKSRLAKKLEKALSRAHEHAENYDDEIQTKVARYKARIAELQEQGRKGSRVESRSLAELQYGRLYFP